MSKLWDYEGYWNAVLGGHRSAADVVAEFDLGEPGPGLDEWLGTSEDAAITEGRKPREETLEAWRPFHARALDELTQAIEGIV